MKSQQQIKVKKKRFKFSKNDYQLTILAAPGTIWFLIFSYLPMAGIFMAFKNYRIIKPGANFFENLYLSDFVGLKNFEFLFSSGMGGKVIKLTLMYNVVLMFLGLVIPVTLAILMNQLYSKRYGKVCQTIMLLPYFMSWVVVSYCVFAFLSPDKGLFNSLRKMLGIEPVNWYREPKMWPIFLVVINLWKGLGYCMIVHLASITSMDHTLFEAALLDGATKWQQTKYITLPMLKPVIIMLFILNIGGIVRSDFGLFYQVTKGSAALFDVTETIDVFIYQATMSPGNINMGAAAAFFQSVMSCILVVGTNWIVKKIDDQYAII